MQAPHYEVRARFNTANSYRHLPEVHSPSDYTGHGPAARFPVSFGALKVQREPGQANNKEVLYEANQ